MQHQPRYKGEEPLNKIFTCTIMAAILGLVAILIPAILLNIYTDVQGRTLDSNIGEPISPTDAKALGICFIIASVIFILFKRESGKGVQPPLMRHT